MSDSNFVQEHEAHTRLCPIKRPYISRTATLQIDYGAPLPQGGYAQRVIGHSYSPGQAYCDGKNCMMWTWVAGSVSHGYCGLREKIVIP